MKVFKNPALRELNTFGVSARAGMLVEVEREEDVLSLPAFDPSRDLVLGGGSNVLFVGDVPGTVFLNRIGGIEVIEENRRQVVVEVGAGEKWHELVRWCLDRHFHGLENLALIPGLAGAAPIQNIGAYGVELASVLDTVTAWDWHTAAWAVLDNQQCAFRYRDSVFKSTDDGRYFITSIRLRLSKQFCPQLDYAGLEEELENAGVRHPQAADVFSAVVRLRQKKLPDPAVEGNAGSFFKNPLVPLDQAESLRCRFPDLPVWKLSRTEAKIAAAWLIEQCGLKGYRHHGAAVSDRHALVLLNRDKASGMDIWQLARHVQEEVRLRFAVELEPEPTIYPGPAKNRQV